MVTIFLPDRFADGGCDPHFKAIRWMDRTGVIGDVAGSSNSVRCVSDIVIMGASEVGSPRDASIR
jgi:hypothetical protein